ncbi:serine/arginine-rich splicing factor 1B-like [Phalaenopsis equestris]|uniref:serine/arginine-rich splicing factor 1B-like n=1 Tax=Phalaenopsis equestris TaxID=78828 RepID=UPI0009E3507A|nr:serine/arginine-rich splicing factor 1B-like [Phalaenopsis equestris]
MSGLFEGELDSLISLWLLRTSSSVVNGSDGKSSCDSKSVYVGNIPPNISSSDLEQEFRKFGRITLDGDGGFCYAFVEFEDVVGVQNALKFLSETLSIFARGKEGKGYRVYLARSQQRRANERTSERAISAKESEGEGRIGEPRDLTGHLSEREDRRAKGSAR